MKSKLYASKRPVLGSFLGIPSPVLVEMLGRAGYDFVILDAEHGVFNKERTEECLRAAAAAGVPCIIRLADLDPNLIQAALDMGASGIQIPSVESPPQAEQAFSFSHFPPDGKRGYGSATRAADYGFLPRPVVKDNAKREILVNIQIESKEGVKNLPEILAIPGIDVVFIGTSDLSMDYGYETPNDPAMPALLEKIITSIVSSGKIAGIHISDWSKIEQLQKLGVKYFTTSAPVVIRDAFKTQVKDFISRVNES